MRPGLLLLLGAVVVTPHEHVWREVYYGVECEICGLFIPDGCEPWMPVDDDPEGPDVFDLTLDDDWEDGT